MKFGKLLLFVCLCAFALPAMAGVTVTSPGDGSTVGSPVHFVASASSPACPNGVAAIGIIRPPTCWHMWSMVRTWIPICR